MPKIYFTLCILLLTCCCARAQRWELGVAGGAAGYMGDLNQRNLLQVSNFSTGAFIRHNFNGYISAKLGYTFGQIEGADSTSRFEQLRSRNLSFFTRLHEVALTGEFNLFRYMPESGRNLFTPYVYAGVAAVNYKPQANYKGEVYELRPLTTEGQGSLYKTTVLSVPFGAGVKYNIAGKLTLQADAGYRTAYSDYLDDVSGVYAPKSIFADEVARALSDRSGEQTGVYTGLAGTQRGDFRKWDTYMFFSIGLSYTFMSQKCYY